MALVYVITNSANGKRYVGKTSGALKARWDGHRYRSFKISKAALHVAMREFGTAAFSIEAIQECDTDAEAILAERDWIARLGTTVPDGYNVRPRGWKAGPEGHTPESIAKMRSIALARGQRPSALALRRSAEVRAAGLSEAAKQSMTEAQRKRRVEQPISDAFREKMRQLKTGKKTGPQKLSDEAREARSASMRTAWVDRKARGGGDKTYVTDDFRARMSSVNKQNRLTSPKFLAKAAKPICQDCGVPQTSVNTGACARRQTGLQRRCKSCTRTYFNEWRARRAAKSST